MGIEMVNHVPWLDFVFSGHALISFPEFLSRLRAGDVDGLHQIDGIFSRVNTCSIESLDPSKKPSVPGQAVPEPHLSGISWIAPVRPLNEAVPLDYDLYLDSYDAKFGDHRARRDRASV